jgi:hypothetical protein
VISENFAAMKTSWHSAIFLPVMIAAFLAGCVTATKQLGEADAMVKAGNLRGAVAKYEEAYAIPVSPKEKEGIAAKIEEVKRKIVDSVLAAEGQHLAKGSTIPILTEAVAIIERDMAYDDAAGRLKAALGREKGLLAKVQAEYQADLKDASAAEAADSWTPGVQALQKAAALYPGDEIKQRTEALIARRDTTVPGRIERLMNAQDMDAVEKEFSRYAAETPKPSGDAFALLERKVDSFRREKLEARLKGFVDAKQYYTAFQLIKDSKRDYLDQRKAEVAREGSLYYKAKALEEQKAGGSRLGYAFFAAEKAWELQPDDAGIFKIRREISDDVNVAITQQISIDVFSAKEKEDGIALSNTLMEHLLANRPFGIQILERSKIDQILQEQGAKRAELAAKVKMWIVGDVTTFNVERQDSKSEGTVKAKTGTKRTPNPAYTNHLIEFGKDQNKWPAGLRSETAEIEEPEFQMITYKQGEVSLRGIMVTSVRAFESFQGAVLAARVFNSIIPTNSAYRDSVPAAEITSIPLQLPTDNEVKESLRTKMAGEIGAFVLSFFEHREQRFLESARKAIGRQEFEPAVADLAGGYFYGHNDELKIPHPETHPTVEEIRRLGFFKYTE